MTILVVQETRQRAVTPGRRRGNVLSHATFASRRSAAAACASRTNSNSDLRMRTATGLKQTTAQTGINSHLVGKASSTVMVWEASKALLQLCWAARLTAIMMVNAALCSSWHD